MNKLNNLKEEKIMNISELSSKGTLPLFVDNINNLKEHIEPYIEIKKFKEKEEDKTLDKTEKRALKFFEKNLSDNKNIDIQLGLPSPELFEKAFASEPLTNLLSETNVLFIIPSADEDISLIAKNEQEVAIGLCSTYRVVKYWTHLEKINPSNQNLSTQIFIHIHKKAIIAEKEYLKQIEQPIEKSFHAAGIAILPEYRGKKIGILMREKQIELCKQHEVTTLFCQTTNRFSAATVELFGFIKIAEYPYSELAVELNHPSLSELDDKYSVWCLKV